MDADPENMEDMLFGFEGDRDDTHGATSDISEDELLDLQCDDEAILWNIDDNTPLIPDISASKTTNQVDKALELQFADKTQNRPISMRPIRDR